MKSCTMHFCDALDSSEIREYVNQAMDELFTTAPANSHVHILFERVQDGYEVTLKMVSNDMNFLDTKKARSLGGAFDKIVMSLRDEVFAWLYRRYNYVPEVPAAQFAGREL